MTEFSPPDPSYLLPPEERERLAPEVDADALQTLLRHLPAEAAPGVLLACRAHTSRAEWDALLSRFPDYEPPSPDAPAVFFQLRFLTPELEALWQLVRP